MERDELLYTALKYVDLTLEDQSKRRMARNLIFNAGRKGQLLVDLDRPQAALPWLFRSYRMSRRFKRQKEPTKRMTTISHAYLLLDKPDMARKAATIGIAYATRDPEWAWSRALASAYEARAKAWYRLGNVDAALVDYQHAAKLLQESYRLLEQDETELTLAARLTKLYDQAIHFSYKVGRLREAFHFLEMSRQPVFRQRLAVTPLAVPSEIPEQLIHQERVLLELLSQGGVTSIDDDEEELDQSLGMTTPSQLESQARRSAKQQIEAVWSQMHNFPAAAEYVALRKGEAISYQRLLDLLAGAQPRRIVVAAFYVTEAKTLLFGVSVDWHEPKVEEVPVARSQLHAFVKSYIDRLDETSNNRANSTRATLAWFDQEGSALLSQLIAPLLDWTEPGDYIYLVPHDLLHHLPLHAVKVNGTYLIERNPVLYSQSVSILEYCVRKRKDQRRSALILADSREDQPIVFAREQAHAIGELFAEARTYVGPNASLRQLIDELRTRSDDIDVLHLAVHGAFSHRASDESGVDLADGRLTPEKLLSLSMRVDLVTMSACDSGAGKYRAGDEMIGLTRALIYAGTPSVVSSLWTVDALSTSIMMREFYTALLEGQQTKAEALQHAQLYVKNLTARAALTYADHARAQLDGDDRACAYLDWTIAEIQFVAHDYAAAQASYQALLARHDLEESIAARTRVGVARARLAATRPISIDYDQRVYADLYNWAPFVLVGDWR